MLEKSTPPFIPIHEQIAAAAKRLSAPRAAIILTNINNLVDYEDQLKKEQ